MRHGLKPELGRRTGGGVSLVVSSTLRRALDTTQILLGDAIAAGGTRAVALDQCRELTLGGCVADLRRPLTAIRANRPSPRHHFASPGQYAGWDFSRVEEEDPLACGTADFEIADLIGDGLVPAPSNPVHARAEQLLEFVWAQPENTVMLVGHGAFFQLALLPRLTMTEKAAARLKKFRFDNGDMLSLSIQRLRGATAGEPVWSAEIYTPPAEEPTAPGTSDAPSKL